MKNHRINRRPTNRPRGVEMIFKIRHSRSQHTATASQKTEENIRQGNRRKEENAVCNDDDDDGDEEEDGR